jgi:hypothetical protein
MVVVVKSITSSITMHIPGGDYFELSKAKCFRYQTTPEDQLLRGL